MSGIASCRRRCEFSKLSSSENGCWGPATDEGRIKAARCGRSVGLKMLEISNTLRTLRRSATTCHLCHEAVLAQLSTPYG